MSITLDGDLERLQRVAKDLRGHARSMVMTAWREVAGVNDSNVPMKQPGKGRKPSCK